MFSNTQWLKTMACGGTPYFDRESEISYRCDICFAVIGSIGQPRSCVEINEQQELEAQNEHRQI